MYAKGQKLSVKNLIVSGFLVRIMLVSLIDHWCPFKEVEAKLFLLKLDGKVVCKLKKNIKICKDGPVTLNCQ